MARIGFWNRGFSSCCFWRGLASSLSRHGFQWSLAGPSGTVGRAPWLLEAMALGWPEAWRRSCHRAQAICAELLGSSGRAKGWEATGIVEYLPRTICQE